MSPHKTLNRPRADQVKNHVIAADLAESEIREAGFEVVSRDDRFIDSPDEESTRWMIVFRKPAGGGVRPGPGVHPTLCLQGAVLDWCYGSASVPVAPAI